jgi:D-glycero-alpha-D-manno-heptose 1-phosphate guanylyltransferase
MRLYRERIIWRPTRPMKAIVLCGGFGTRLGVLTRYTPKPLLEVAGRPFIAYVLDNLVAHGVNEIALAVSFQWSKLHSELGESWKGTPLRYSVEHQPLGTGGAIKHAMDQLGWENALVANGDTLLKTDPLVFGHFAALHSMDVVIALKPVADAERYGRVRISENSRIVAFEEKGENGPGLINAGLYWVSRHVLAKPNRSSFSFEYDVLSTHTNGLRIAGIETDAYFIDIGIPDDLERARREF